MKKEGPGSHASWSRSGPKPQFTSPPSTPEELDKKMQQMHPPDMPVQEDGSPVEEPVPMTKERAKAIGGVDHESAMHQKQVDEIIARKKAGEDVDWGPTEPHEKFHGCAEVFGENTMVYISRTEPSKFDFGCVPYKTLRDYSGLYFFIATQCDKRGEGGVFLWNVCRSGRRMCAKDRLILEPDPDRPRALKAGWAVMQTTSDEAPVAPPVVSSPPAQEQQPMSQSPSTTPRNVTWFPTDSVPSTGWHIIEGMPGAPSRNHVAAVKLPEPVVRERVVEAPRVEVPQQQQYAAPRPNPRVTWMPPEDVPAGWHIIEGLEPPVDGYVAVIRLPQAQAQQVPQRDLAATIAELRAAGLVVSEPRPAAPAPVPAPVETKPEPAPSLGTMVKRAVGDFVDAKTAIDEAQSSITAAAGATNGTSGSSTSTPTSSTSAVGETAAAIGGLTKDDIVETPYFRTFRKSDGTLATLGEALHLNMDHGWDLVEKALNKHRDMRMENLEILERETEALKKYAESHEALRKMGVQAPSGGSLGRGQVASTKQKTTTAGGGPGVLGAMKHGSSSGGNGS